MKKLDKNDIIAVLAVLLFSFICMFVSTIWYAKELEKQIYERDKLIYKILKVEWYEENH